MKVNGKSNQKIGKNKRHYEGTGISMSFYNHKKLYIALFVSIFIVPIIATWVVFFISYSYQSPNLDAAVGLTVIFYDILAVGIMMFLESEVI